MAIHRRRQHLQWHDLDSLHAGEFAIDSLAGGSSGIRWQRQSLGQRHERRCCANHDWRASGNTDANANCYSNCHADSYSKRNTNGNSHCNGNPHRNTDCYYYAYSKAYSITEGSFYTAASRNSAAKALIGVRGIAMKTLSIQNIGRPDLRARIAGYGRNLVNLVNESRGSDSRVTYPCLSDHN
jgi:hypothetical protein